MDIPWHDFKDELGPDKILLLHDPQTRLEAFVAIDNVACGPAIGGLRMSPDVSPEETFRLARTMTLKNAAVGLPHGGGKAGIVSSPKLAPADKEALIRAFARAIRSLEDYIPGPDMGTNEESMAIIRDEMGRSVGLPRVLGGIPLDEIGATGFGLAVCAAAAQEHGGPRLEGARVAIQGFGSVGRHAARYLASRGAIIVAAADSAGATTNADGLDVEELSAHKLSGQSVRTFAGGTTMDNHALLAVDCDIWVPAAQPDVIDERNAGQLKARLVLCGANLPVTPQAEGLLHEAGILVVPDFIANAGGVICAATEYHGGSQDQAMASIEQLIGTNTGDVLRQARASGQRPRAVALALATSRIRQAMSYRRGPRAPSAS